ncbi:4-demethylwyosine synthase TYW1 [Candidatus Woesearchaeota archaeon]|nr:4-demethylwyosine synthase TYW1 [Candidatus Woesearchaeota archaeon]
MISQEQTVKLEKQGYRLVGSHSAVKICEWTKKSLLDKNFCYKEKFYGIKCHRCCQMTSCLACSNSCLFCWRDSSTPLSTYWRWEKFDEPDEIIEKSIAAQRKLLTGFGGNDKVNRKKLKEAMEPMHFALSLVGESMLYPKINGLIKKLHKLGKTTFLVTRGQHPEILGKMEMPTQLYLSIDAPNKDLFNIIDKPLFKEGWERSINCLELMKKFKHRTRTTMRITMLNNINMILPEKYAELVNLAEPMFVEVKGYVWVGSSRKRLKEGNMPSHKEVREFAEKIADKSDYKIVDEKEESRVVLLMKENREDRIMKFD